MSRSLQYGAQRGARTHWLKDSIEEDKRSERAAS